MFSSDTYQRLILTLIALVLIVIAIRLWIVPQPAEAYSREPIPVYVVNGPYSNNYLEIGIDGALKARVVDGCECICTR